MLLNGKALSEVSEDDLRCLIDKAELEQRTLEYKEKLPARSDEQVKEFLADVCSFANSAGGHIVYGMTADGDKPVALVGLGQEDSDSTILRLESSVRDGIEPKIPGVRSRAVGLSEGNWALVLEVPKSFAGPHMVRYKGTSRFFGRNSRGKFQMDVHEIRAAFAASETLSDKLRSFRFDRLAKVQTGETPVRLVGHARIVLHIVPISAFDLRASIDLRSIARSDLPSRLLFLGQSSLRFNLDGLLAEVPGNTDDKGSVSFRYTQLFRSGIVEAVDAYRLSTRDRDRVIPFMTLEEDLISLCQRALEFERRIGTEPPLVIFLSMLGVAGYRMPESDRISVHVPGARIDRDTVLLPEAWLDEYPEDALALLSTLKPVFDAFWNATGLPEWLTYGTWVARYRGK